MKLTKRQIEAISNEFISLKKTQINEFKESNQFKNVKLTKEQNKIYNLIKEYNEIEAKQKVLKKEINDLKGAEDYWHSVPHPDAYKLSISEKEFKDKLIIPSYKDVEDKLILMTLNSDVNSEDILNQLSKLF